MSPRQKGPVPEHEMPRFAGEDTFMKLPRYQLHQTVSVLIIGAPFDGGTTFRPGARMGPRAIRNASAGLYPYHRQRGLYLTEKHAVADAGDLFVVPWSVEKSLQSMEEALGALPYSTRILLLGGDHSVSLAPLRALGKKLGPIALIHLDSHTDLWDEFWGSRYNHATVFRRALEEGWVDPTHSIQIGLRGSLDEASEDQFGVELGIDQITTDQWMEMGGPWVVERMLARVSDKPVYVSCDIDVVDPAYAPGTGTPEAGGPTSYMVLSLLRALRCRVVGADVVELAPDLDVTGNSALFAATVAHDLLFSMI